MNDSAKLIGALIGIVAITGVTFATMTKEKEPEEKPEPDNTRESMFEIRKTETEPEHKPVLEEPKKFDLPVLDRKEGKHKIISIKKRQEEGENMRGGRKRRKTKRKRRIRKYKRA
jgi:hypothetical protein